MAFEVYGSAQNEGKKQSSVNYDELNQYVVDTAGLQEQETLIGYISQIIDVGTQEQPDSEVVFVGTEDDEREEIAKNPKVYFKNGIDQISKKPARLKCWQNKPVQCVVVAVDFPDIIVDKGQFFGNSKPLPLRMYLGGQFYIEGHGHIVQRPTPLKVNKAMGTWSFDKKHLFYKMAVGCKLIKDGEVFLPKDIDKLLGKAFQFEAQVFFKPGKNGKSYYTERIKYVGGLGRGQKEPEMLTTPMLIQFNVESEEDAIKEIRNHVVNTIKRAANYEGSVIQKQIEPLRGAGGSVGSSGGGSGSEKQAEQPSFNDNDDDAPF